MEDLTKLVEDILWGGITPAGKGLIDLMEYADKRDEDRLLVGVAQAFEKSEILKARKNIDDFMIDLITKNWERK